jgi:hypothetical protein
MVTSRRHGSRSFQDRCVICALHPPLSFFPSSYLPSYCLQTYAKPPPSGASVRRTSHVTVCSTPAPPAARHQTSVDSAYDAEYAFSTDIYDQGTQEILASKASKEEEITLFNAHVIETLSPSSTNDWKALEVALQTTDYVLRLPRHRPGGGELRSRGAAKRQRLHGAGARTTGAAGIERVSKEQEEEQGKTQEQEQKMTKKTQVPSHEPAVAKVAASVVETQDGDAEEEDGEDINHDMQHAFELEALPRNVHIALSDAHAMELLQFSNTAA